MMRFPTLLLLATLPLAPLFIANSNAQTKPQPSAKPAAKTPAKKLTPAQLKEKQLDALWEASDAKFHAGDYPSAIAIHRKIQALDPSDAESYSVASWLSWSLGKREDGLALIQSGLKANPKDPEMWDAAGQHYNLQKLPLKAETAFGKAIQLSGKSADMMLRRRYAHAAQDAGHLAKSITIWSDLVADFPKDQVNKNNLARAKRAAAPKGGGGQSV